MACLLVCRHWGQMASQKRMNFRKSSKQPLIPPLIFGKSYCIFLEFHAQNPYLKVQNLQYEFLDLNDPPHFETFLKNSSVLVTPSVP